MLSKVLEDLLERRLTDSIFSHADLLSFTLNGSKEVADGLIFLGYPDLVEITTLLEQLYLFELLGQELDELESMLLSVEELYEALKTH